MTPEKYGMYAMNRVENSSSTDVFWRWNKNFTLHNKYEPVFLEVVGDLSQMIEADVDQLCGDLGVGSGRLRVVTATVELNGRLLCGDQEEGVGGEDGVQLLQYHVVLTHTYLDFSCLIYNAGLGIDNNLYFKCINVPWRIFKDRLPECSVKTSVV